MGKHLQNLINKSIDMGYIDFDKNRIGDLTNLNDRDVVVLISDEKDINRIGRIGAFWHGGPGSEKGAEPCDRLLQP